MRIEKRKTKPIIRISAILLCICLAVQNVSLITFAAEAVEEQTEELYTGEFTTELSSESFTENPESTEKATEEQIEETVQEPISEKQEETEQESTKQEISDRETETIAQTSEHESDMTSEEASITKEENISEETTTDNESETESIADEDSRTEIDNFSGEAVSRIEWLRELIAAFELNLDKENYPDNYYSDIDAKSEYYHDIMVATGYGLIDVEAGEAFCPDDAATREYAAFSMNMRVGYVNESNSYTFSEAGEVAYADDIQAAINNGWMTLSGSDFLPNKALTTDVKDHMIKEAKEIYASRKIDPNHNNQFEFTDDVIVIPSNTIVELSAENEIIITDCPKELKQGDIFAVFDSGMPLAYRAENVNKSGNQTIVSIGDVDIEDAFETFDMEGIINTDLTSVFVEDDDETVQLNYIVGGSEKKQFKDGTKYENLEELGNKEVSAVQIVQEFDYNEVNGKKWFGETSGDYYESNPAYKFTITQTISNIDVNYRSNGISSVYLTVSGNISIDCSLNLDLLDAFMPELKVVKIHVTPLAVTLDLDAVVTLKGKAVFNYDGYFEIGVDFKHNRGFKLVSHLWGETFSTQIEAEATVGLRASINANYVFIKGSLYAQMGLKGGISMLDKDDNGEPKKCVTIYAYLYADYGWSVKILISLDRNKKWSNNYKIYTIDNSPFRIAHHYENGVGVDKCTRSKKSLTGSTVGPMWFYNTPSNSKYGYNGGSSGFDSDGNPFTIFEYSLNEDNEATITKYNGNVSALSIPAELDGYKVVGIGDGVFKGKTALRTVVIPDSVESIGNQAFSGCANLSSVQLPENEKFVTLSSRLFYECKKLKRVKIPNSIISIKDNVFNNCESLEDVNLPNKLNSISYQVFMNVPITKITIPKSLETASGYYNGANICGAFYNCSTLKEVNFEEGVTKIPSRLFAGCNGIEKIIVPNTVTNIEERAFEDCINLEKAEIPDSVTSMGNNVFQDCEKLADVDLPNRLVTIGYQVFTNVPITKITIPKSLETASGYYNGANICGAFYNCSTLKEVNFEEGVTKIPSRLFAGCNGIEKIIVPNTVTNIEERAFEDCINLEKAEIPDSVTSMGNNVFQDCEKLADVDLPNRLVTIGYQVFTNVPITKITIPKSLETASGYYNGANICGAFYNCSTLKEVNFEERVTKIPSRLFAGCNGIEKIVVPNTVTNVEERAFEDCINLEKIEIPDSVINIGDYVFKDCEKLDNIIIPDTVTKIGQGTYSGCTSLTTAKLPNKIVNIPEGMFQDCTSLITIDLPTTITAIKQNAFKNTGLTELTLPENITTIENASFDNCTNLATVNFNNNLKTIGNYAFRNNDALSEIMIPNNVATIGNYAFQDSDALTTVKISDSVTTIGQYIFEHCDALKDVKLGSGLTKIPLYAFNLCPELQKIVLPYRITTVDANAFTNCTKLTEVIIPRGTTTISASAFSYPDRLTIYGISGTYAETYANQIGATFVNREVNAEDITLGSTSLSMITGAKHTLVMNVTPNDFTDEVVWKSSDTSIVTVDNMGIITAKAVGTATVRVAVGEKTASCTVTVVQPVTSISLNKSSLSLEAFEEYLLTAMVSPSNAADKSIVWASSDEAVVSVTQKGKVCAVSKGTAAITATAKDGSGKYGSCNVTVVSEGQLCTQYSGLESDHNYANNTNKVWKYVYSGAKTLDITFDSRTNVDDGFDFIYIYDKENKEVKKATGTELADQIIRITGDTVKIKLVSDEAVTAWGFKVTKISDDGKVIDPSDEKPEETETSTEEGSTEESSSEETSTEENSTEETSTEENSTEEESSTEDSGETIKDGCYITGLKTKTYTGSAVKQDIKVYYNKHLLQEGADYTVSYKNNVHAGIASLTVRAKGNLTGTITKTYKIKPRDITDEDVIIEESVYSYDKKKHKKAPIISYQGKKLKEGKDYEVISYDEGDYTAIGTYTATIRGLGNFTGTYDNAKIIIADKNKNLSKAKIAKIPTQSYQNGTAVTLPEEQIKVTLKGKHLKNGIDYNVTYANNRNFGKATIVIKGIGEYAGTKKANFTIKRTLTRLSDNMVVNINAIRTVEIQKNGAIPKPKLVSEGSTLLEGRDYRLSYKNNKKTGIGTMIIKGKGNYTGQLKLPFNITTKALTSTNLTIRVPNVPYIGKRNKYQSKPIITDNDGGLLILNKDYTIEAYHMGNMLLDKTSNPQEGALITVTIKGKGNYTGIVEAVYELRGSRFSQAVIQIAPKSYTGNPVELNVSDIILATIKTGKHKTLLQYGIDYEIVDYKNNIKKGTATVVFKGKGAYAGEKTVRFKITAAEIGK